MHSCSVGGRVVGCTPAVLNAIGGRVVGCTPAVLVAGW